MKMSCIILNAMPKDDLFSDKINNTLIEESDKFGLRTELIELVETEIRPCLGCFKCWVQTPGICVIDDFGIEIAKKIIQSDTVIYLSPIVFGGYSSELKKALDRTISLISPFFRVYKGEVHHEKRYDNYPNLLVFGVLDKHNKEQEEIFVTLVERNTLNMFNPNYATRIIYQTDSESQVKEKIISAFTKIGEENE